MGPGYPGVIQGAPQMESSLNNPNIASTHANVADVIDPMVSHPGRTALGEWSRSLDRASWCDIPGKIPPVPEDTPTISLGETDCPGKSNPTNVTSIVSANNAETPRGLSGAWTKRVQLVLQFMRPYVVLAQPPFLKKP